MNEKRPWVYAGSFDPVTNGHLDIIKRAAEICDKLIVGVLVNQNKTYTFDQREREDMLKTVTNNLKNVEIESFSGLLVNFLHKHDSNVIIKGLRAISDYEYELQMAHLNRYVDENVETLFLMSSLNNNYISSGMVKEVGSFGGDISGLVPKEIVERVQKRIMK